MRKTVKKVEKKRAGDFKMGEQFYYDDVVYGRITLTVLRPRNFPLDPVSLNQYYVYAEFDNELYKIHPDNTFEPV